MFKEEVLIIPCLSIRYPKKKIIMHNKRGIISNSTALVSLDFYVWEYGGKVQEEEYIFTRM